MLNPRRAKEFVVPSTLTRRIAYFALFLANVPGTFFNARHQVKAIAIAVSKVIPQVYIGDCSSPLNLNVFLPINPQNRYKELFPNTHFYIALYSRFCGFIGITFTRPVFLFKIDHDNGTVSTNYATF